MRKPIQLPLPESANKRVIKVGISVGIAGAAYRIAQSDSRSTVEGALDYVLNMPERFKVFTFTFEDETEVKWEWNVQAEMYTPLA